MSSGLTQSVGFLRAFRPQRLSSVVLLLGHRPGMLAGGRLRKGFGGSGDGLLKGVRTS